MTSSQALVQELHRREDWFVRMKKNDTTQQIELLFFCRKSSQRILKLNYEVLILDATYKTNKYKLPLLVITGVTALDTSFYVAFCFMNKERNPQYLWVMEQLKALYDELSLPYPNVLLTDAQKALTAACITVFPQSEHLLCVWHIHNNLTENCMKDFANKDEWESFEKDFECVMYATTEEEFEDQWTALQEHWNDAYPVAVSYIADNMIPRKKEFVSFWTNQHLHFNNHTTSRGEANNGKLKKELHGLSIGDLKHVVDTIDLMLMNELQTYLTKFDEAKMGIPIYTKKPIFRDLSTKVSPFALKAMLPQYLKVVHHEMKPCTRYFTTTMGLPCAHVMERRMNEGDQVLKLTDIHSHWHLKREESSENHDESDEAAAELLRVNEPAVAKPAGRPPGAKGKKRTRQQAFDESTRREPSGFEYAAADALARQQGLTASPGVAARGGRGRGVPRGSRAPDGGSTRGGGRARNGGSTRGGGRARDGGSAGITRGGDRPIPAAGYRSKDTETEQSTNGSDHDDSDQDSITSSIAAKWALSDDPQLDERMWRVKSGDDFGGRLQQYVDNHRRKVERDPEATRAEAQSWRKHWAEQVGCQPNGRLTRKEYHYATGRDDIPRPPRYDDLNPIFKAPDMSRSMGERLHSWAVCDPDKKDDLNPLRHSPERVLGYWKKYDAEGRMPTNPLATPQASAVAIAQAAVAMVQDPVPAVTRPLAKRPKRPTRRGGSTGSRGAGSRGARGARGATGATGGTGGHGGSAS